MMVADVRRGRAPAARTDEGGLGRILDDAPARGTGPEGALGLSVRPSDIGPTQLMARAAGRAFGLIDAPVGSLIGAKDAARALVDGRGAHHDLPVAEGRGAALRERNRVAFAPHVHFKAVHFVEQQDARRVAAKVAGRAGGDELQRPAPEATAEERVAVALRRRQRRPQRGALREGRLDVAHDEVAAVGLRRKHHEDRRGVIGDEVPEHGHGKLGVADSGALQDRHALHGRVAHAAGDLGLMRPQAHAAGVRREARREMHVGLDPCGEVQHRRRP